MTTPKGASGVAPAATAVESAEPGTRTVAVFALDAALAERLRDAVPRIELHAAATVPEFADLLVAQPCRALGVEVAALGAGAHDLLARLAGLFPDLPVVALGSPEDARIVAPLLANGEVHAFLARPIVAAAARDAFESALRRNEELSRNADLRRAAVLRRSSTFLVHASPAVEPPVSTVAACTTRAGTAGRAPRPHRTRQFATGRAARAAHPVELGLPPASRHRPASSTRAAAAALVAVLAVALAGTWIAGSRFASGLEQPPSPDAHAPARVAPTAPLAAPPPQSRGAEDRVLAAEHALESGRLEDADAHARFAAAALGAADAALAGRIATVLDAVATAHSTAQRAARAEARWARAAREWERIRAEDAAPPARASRTSDASSAPSPPDPAGAR